MRSVHRPGVRGLLLALIAVACAHCGSVQGAAKAGKADAGEDPADVADAANDDAAGDTDAGGTDGNTDGGNAAVVGSGNDHCATATPIPLSGKNPRVDLMASTDGATHDIDAFCSTEQGADTFYQFAVSKRVIVYADTFGASWNTVLFLLSSTCEPIPSTMPGGAVCNDDGCGSQQSQIVAVLEPGSYRLGLAGRGAAHGAATIHFEWALAGSGAIAQLPATNSVQVGVTSGSGGNIDGISGSCVAAGAEDSFWWARCPGAPAQTLHASTCDGGTSWESVLEAQIPKTAPGVSSAYQCNVDGCGLQATLNMMIPAGPGLGVLSIDGQGGNDVGPYSMTVTYSP
jgi:hypothetical protein